MIQAVTDTHSLIWFLQDSSKLGKEASKIFTACDEGEAVIYIPTICLVEIIYLQEKGKIPEDYIKEFLNELKNEATNFIIVDLSIGLVESLMNVPREQIADMPDRIIAATSVYLGMPVISRDHKIQFSEINTIW